MTFKATGHLLPSTSGLSQVRWSTCRCRPDIHLDSRGPNSSACLRSLCLGRPIDRENDFLLESYPTVLLLPHRAMAESSPVSATDATHTLRAAHFGPRPARASGVNLNPDPTMISRKPERDLLLYKQDVEARMQSAQSTILAIQRCVVHPNL